LRVSIKAIIFGENYFSDILPVGKHWLSWDKLNTMPTFGDCELIWTNCERDSVKKITFEWNGLIGKEGTRYHPTQKPLSLMRWIIEKYSKPNDIILDPFAGSGTTLVASEELGRRYLGFELSEKYCAVARKRLDAARNQTRLFVSEARPPVQNRNLFEQETVEEITEEENDNGEV
jgi:DNA modification methylase